MKRLVMCLFIVGCSEGVTTESSSDALTGSCTPCGWGEESVCCTEAQYCVWGGYLPGQCRSKEADGEACATNSTCLSGECTEGICRAKECRSEFKVCTATAQCCAGFCGGNSYVGRRCTPLGDTGAFCDDGTECKSGYCTDSICE